MMEGMVTQPGECASCRGAVHAETVAMAHFMSRDFPAVEKFEIPFIQDKCAVLVGR